MRGADIVMQTLARRGVSDIFALSGNQIMPLFDASLDAGIRLYHTRHEAATVYMAEGHAQITGGVGVALVTAGAGLGNALGPLLTARASDTPVLLISGDSPVAQDGNGAFQEMDQVALTQSLTKWSVRVTDADELGAVIDKALTVAQTGRPGPVHVSLPADVVLAEGQASEAAASRARAVETDGIAKWLAGCDTPLVVLGPALNGTRAAGLAARLERALDAPAIVMESPRGLNDPALGHLTPVFRRAERILLLGKPLDFTLQFGNAAPQAEWGIVSSDPAELARATLNAKDRLTLSVEQSASDTAGALAERSTEVARSDWRGEVARYTAKRAATPTSHGLQPQDLCRALQPLIDEANNPILVCDGGEFGQWAQAGLNAPRRIINGVSGAIGGGLCYAMASRAADPGATVFVLMGDGTAGFHFAEFETAAREGLPFVAIIGNDRRWNAEHQIQLRDFGDARLHGCNLSDARYDEAVKALGGFGALVTDLSDLPEAVRAAIASGKPACINVEIEGLPAPVVR
ncbi:thiamine pyrophosphate-binding protein [Marivita sp. S2033]|uniref:thiamine pyrophosphate-binding protein n=1 Tax=Marivita sp. S2033 TaxID=3373187 RepID=UPI0039829676